MDTIIYRILPVLLYPIVYLYYMTIDMRIFVSESAKIHFEKEKYIFTNYHNQIVPFFFYFRRSGYYALVSRSRDGDITDYIMRRLGYNTIRGSSTSGGTDALYDIGRELKKDIVLSMTFDGPKGPLYKIKKGILWVAGRYDYPIIKGYCYYSKAKRLRSWDGLYVPLPFSKVLLVLDGPFEIDTKRSKKAMEDNKARVEKEMWEGYKANTLKFKQIFKKEPVNLKEIETF